MTLNGVPAAFGSGTQRGTYIKCPTYHSLLMATGYIIGRPFEAAAVLACTGSNLQV